MFKAAFEKECKCVHRAFKLIIMDIQMPVLDGIQATKQIIKILKGRNIFNSVKLSLKRKSASQKLKSDTPFTNVVVLTSFTNQSIIDQCLQIGAKQVFSKPLTMDKLSEIMSSYFFTDL
jgi:DNA-binding NarL/FixJ family response regulator